MDQSRDGPIPLGYSQGSSCYISSEEEPVKGGGGKEAHLGSLGKGSSVCPLWLSHACQPQGIIQDFKFNAEPILSSP